MRYYTGLFAYLVLSVIFVAVVFQSFGWIMALIAVIMLLAILYLVYTIF